jgi:four helix bundle protein
MRDFKRLKVWQRAHELALSIYKVTSTFPRQEMYGLTSQMRRASVSVAANIAEGSGKGSEAEYTRYLRIASGSANEVEYLLLLARDLGYLDEDKASALGDEVSQTRRMLIGLIRSLHSSD